MGGIAEYGASLDTKTAPRSAEIERAQAELQFEYDAREERKRELEFLEKGGNLLDYKFSLATSISLQSTSLTDQIVEPHFTSEAKGSFALAASPHGDSAESSGKPRVSVSREANIADNLLLLDHENSHLDNEEKVKPKGKRGSTAHFEQTSDFGGSQNVKELEDSLSLHHAAKGQAYARRNRSRTNRNGASLASTVFHHENRASTLSSTRHSPKGTKECLSEGQTEIGANSSNNDSKAASLNANATLKDSEDRADMDLDPLINNMASVEVNVGATDSPELVDNTNNLKQYGPNITSVVAKKVSDGIPLQRGEKKVEEESLTVDVIYTSLELNTSEKYPLTGIDVNGANVLDITVTDVVCESLSDKTCITDTNDIRESRDEGKSSVENSTLLLKSIGNKVEEIDNKLTDEGTSLLDGDEVREKDQLISINKKITLDEQSSCLQVKDGVSDTKVDTECDGVPTANGLSTKLNGEITAELEFGSNNSIGILNCIKESIATKNAVVLHDCETPVDEKKIPKSAIELPNPSTELTQKEREDIILKEACVIEANLKRACNISAFNKLSEKQHKCHWDFVLEEMVWMANDFMQERLWKITAAAQISRLISSSSCSNFECMNIENKQRNMARVMAKGIMRFWLAAKLLCCNQSTLKGDDDRRCTADIVVSWNLKQSDAKKLEVNDADRCGKVLTLQIQDYAVRFLKFSSGPSTYSTFAEAPATPDRQKDPGILDMSCEEQEPHENLFFVVPPGAMQAYRNYIESQCIQYKKTGHMVRQDDFETSTCDYVAEENKENAYEEDVGDTGPYFLPLAGDLSSKLAHKKKKLLKQKSYAPRSYEAGTNLSYDPCVESKVGNQPFMINGKRPSLPNVGSIPTKRIRTASRQRAITPFTAAVNAATQVSTKTDVSSGDTSSLQDDQSSLHGGSQPRKSLEVDSSMDFEMQLTYDSNEVSTKVKKKKSKHLGYKNSLNLSDSGLLTVSGKGPSFESRLQVDSMFQHDQKDYVKKRIENQHFDSNGTSVPYGQHAAKKPKILKQLPDISPEAPNPVVTGSVPSPAASQMSNMPNSNKLLKIISRDRGRKPKGLKFAAGQPGSGSPWSNYEDQALVVLVHDLGANWELVSDAINSILLFKRFFRTPKECKERHKALLDKSAGDGADSAEDSGSSQPYPSTLPGIPKGSARQLLQRLQGPIEEDVIKKHFDKIISLERQLHSYRRQNATQESKQIIPAHSSHVIAVSQACPSHMKGGILTPLDLCDANSSSPDVFPLAYQGAHTGGLVIPSHHGSIAPIHPASGVNTMLQGSSALVLSGSLPSSSVSLSPSPRDAQRYNVTRTNLDDSQRMHQYSQMFSGRSIQQSGMPMNGQLQTGGDGIQVYPSSAGVGMTGMGVNRSMPVQKSGLSGMAPNMLNMVSAGNVLSNSGQGMQNHVNIHHGTGNSMLKPRGSLHMLRPGERKEEHRQMMMQESHVQASQGNGQAITSFNGMNAPFPNLPVPPSIQTFSVQQHPQSHTSPRSPHMLGNSQHPHMSSTQSSSQQQAYAMRRQLQQRNQPQAPFPGSGVVPPVQGNTQVQASGLSSPVTPVASSPAQNKQQNLPRNLQSATQNPSVKQKQRQQIPQQQQRQQPPQQGKLVKNIGRPNMLMHQNVAVDCSQVVGFSTGSKAQASERHMAPQGQSFFPNNSGLSQNLPQSTTQAKMYSQLSQSSKQMTSAFDSSNLVSSPSNMASSQQAPLSNSVPLPSQHQQQQRHLNQSPQTIRMLQQNRNMNADGRVQCSAEQVQANQTIASTSTTHCTESSTSATTSVNQWKSDPQPNANSPTTNLAKSMPEDSMANEILAAPSSQVSNARQFSGNVPAPGHSVGGQWLQ